MSGVSESDLPRVKVCLADNVDLASSVFEFSGATGDYRYRVGHDGEETGRAEVFELNSGQLSLVQINRIACFGDPKVFYLENGGSIGPGRSREV